jgi:hypothetical protein
VHSLISRVCFDSVQSAPELAKFQPIYVKKTPQPTLAQFQPVYVNKAQGTSAGFNHINKAPSPPDNILTT